MFYYQTIVRIKTTRVTKQGPKDVFKRETYIVKAESIPDAEEKTKATYKNTDKDFEVIAVREIKLEGVLTK